MYRNSSYGNKWFYAYITDMKYINDNLTAISIKTDVYQTWCFDLTFKSSFVEREHVSNDTIGNHTVPEGLEHGEYKVQSHLMDSVNGDVTIILGTSEDYLDNYSFFVQNYQYHEIRQLVL